MIELGFHTDAFNSAYWNFDQCLEWAHRNSVRYIECGAIDGVSWIHGLGDQPHIALWQAKYHMQNWLDCMRSRQKPLAGAEIGHRSVSIAHLANITRQLGRKLRWDPAAERFEGDAEANELVSRPRRKGYELPAIG